MDSPLISVIVPVYNAEHTLKECIDSILTQSVKDFELILVDDGSKDHSPKMCDEYAVQDNRIVVIHKQNGGVSSARNAGLDIAKGKWITFIDSDDSIANGYFENIDYAQEDLLICGFKKKKGQYLFKGFNPKDCYYHSLANFLKVHLSNSIVRSPWGKFYQKRLVGSMRFLTDMKIGEDSQFVFRYLAQCSTFCLIKNAEYIFNVDDRPDDIKYAINVDYAERSLTHLLNAFKEMENTHHIGKASYIPYLSYFKKISKNEWRKKPSLWYRNKEINKLYQYIWDNLPIKQKLKFILIKNFSY
ncbi:MAG: glycosyltransferase [Prevotella sp.]|nr:glycosyltransferase [Prevotella sp.]